MNRYKLNCIVEYIKTLNEFPFDMADVEEGIEKVLVYFGLDPKLDQDEEKILANDFLGLAKTFELAEVGRLIAQDEEPELNWLGQTDYPETFARRKKPSSVSVSDWMKQFEKMKSGVTG